MITVFTFDSFEKHRKHLETCVAVWYGMPCFVWFWGFCFAWERDVWSFWGPSWARAPCGVWSCEFSCSWHLLGMGSDGRYALVCGDLKDDCGDFSLGGWKFWDCVEFGISCWTLAPYLRIKKKLINLTTSSHYCRPHNCKLKFCSIFIVDHITVS